MERILKLSMNYIDIIILVIFAVFVFKSYKKGFTGEVFGILALLVSFALSIKLNPHISGYINKYMNNEKLAVIVCFAGTFIIINILIRRVGISIKNFLQMIHLGWLDSIAGAAIGGVKAILICALLLLGLRLVPFAGVGKAISKSQIAPQIEKVSGSFYSALKKGFPKELNKRFFENVRLSKKFFSK